MQKIYQEYKDEGFNVLAVNAAFQDSPNAARKFIIETGLDFPIPLDENGETARRYQVRSFPTSFFLDQNGIIQEVVVGGPMTEALLRTRVENLLNAQRGGQ